MSGARFPWFLRVDDVAAGVSGLPVKKQILDIADLVVQQIQVTGQTVNLGLTPPIDFIIELTPIGFSCPASSGSS